MKNSYVTAFIEGFFILDFFSYYAHVPLNSRWHTAGGMCTTV
jgi:hypothetical protein